MAKKAVFEKAFPYGEDLLALPVTDLDSAASWYAEHFAMVEAERKPEPYPTVIMERDGVRIGFGIMGGWNQAQAHAQFVANIVDYGLDIQQALEVGRFTKPTFDGCDVFVESLVPETTRRRLMELGHEVTVVPPRTGTFGFGQAVMPTPSPVHFGASEPRHDGAAIPEAPPVH